MFLKYIWKHDDAVEVQRQFKSQFQTQQVIRLTIIQIRYKVEVDETVSKNHISRYMLS